ncbi:uridine kinase [Aerococcus urinaehominis]|uniref:Uridine kinase n=1 Tax=Aerococcus urinaehominis TaxID=128944 RepID=A0A0X8FM02_9LACT|nr:uridine kinase [Aerococcus urinaehominis]AMB99765.1 uridine kinase [Aerococcus urinaehominis]SDM09842.1 uridine kinase [Aerococcus urinaehominis]
MAEQIIIGVTGGSGSGKTSVTKQLMSHFDNLSLVYIEQDAYYKDQSDKPMSERIKTNYDHPKAFDMELLKDHVRQLMAGHAIDMPVYDYSQHTRSDQTVHLEPKEIIIIEGILVLDDPELRDLMDIKVFVETDADVRILRRIVRDMEERGRTLESVIDQYLSVVKPMHEQFIEPTKRYADIIIPEGGSNTVAIDLLQTKLSAILLGNSAEK